MVRHRCDVVVVGAGFAGASACIALRAAGLEVIVLEARDRVGGRAFTRPFRPSGEMMEFGGSWIASAHHRIRHHCAQHDIHLVPTPNVTLRRWHDGSALRGDGPVANGEQGDEYNSAMGRIRADALAFAHGNGDARSALSQLSLNEYLQRLAASREARAQILAWWCISGNGDPGTISAAEFISSCAHGDGSPESMMSSLAHSLTPGAGELVARMIASSRAQLHLGTTAEGVRQSAEEVVVETTSGESFGARAVILTVPLNVLAALHFAPLPGPRKLEAAATGHGGRSFKLWIKARGANVGTLVTGGLGGIQWMFVERETDDGAVMIVGFGLLENGFCPSRRSDVEAGLQRFLPRAELLAFDWHDWTGDPFARGTWLATPAKAAWIADAGEWRNEGRVFFASADFAPGTPGWFESAIVSGEDAAESVQGVFSYNKRSAVST